MKPILLRNKFAILFILFLLFSLVVTTWKMHLYKDKYQEITHNQRWENMLTENNIYHDDSIVFLGDSQISRWQMAPSFGSLPVLNRGISGDFALKVADRFDKDVLKLKPRLLVLLIGTNDLAIGQTIDAILNNIEAILKKANTHKIKVILCSLLPVAGKYIQDHPLDDILAINNRFSELSLKHNADYVDFHSQLIYNEGQFMPDLTSDGLHPSRSGYLKMTKILFPYLVDSTH